MSLRVTAETYEGPGEWLEDLADRRAANWLAYERGVKHVLDFALAIVGLILLAPFFLVVAVAIRLDSSGPVIFRQQRVGKSGRLFDLYKFRSMCLDAEEQLEALWPRNELDGPVFKIKDDPRLTRVGRFIRRYSIDELPQLLNVLKGEMSVVGPRPPLPREVATYSAEDWVRLSVLPGLTCMWQVSGRSDTSFEHWMKLDRQYVRGMCLGLDLSLIFQTVWVVFGGHGAY